MRRVLPDVAQRCLIAEIGILAPLALSVGDSAGKYFTEDRF
jgi:hypothetical protein